MISCKEAVGLNNKIGTCWNIAIQTNMFYGHNSEIIQQKLNHNSVDELLNPTVIEHLERFLPPFLLDDTGKLSQRSLDIMKKIVINLKKRFDIKNKQKVTKMKNAEEDICERDFVYYTFELIHPGKRNKEDEDEWGGRNADSFFLTNILDIILLNKLTHIVMYDSDYLSKGNRLSLNIDKIKNIKVSVHESDVPLDITDLTVKSKNHACQFFECGGSTKYSNNDTIIEHDWHMFFKILNMLSVSDYDSQKNDSGFTKFAEYDTPPNPLPKYQIWQNLSIGPYIVTYDSELKPSVMYSFSPFFKTEKIISNTSILAEGLVKEFHFSYNIQCTPEHIKKLIGLNAEHYLSLDMMNNNTLMAQRLLDLMDVNIIDKDKETIIHKGIIAQNIIFVTEALKRINKTTLNYQNKNGYTALIRALLKTNIPLIKEIMKYKPDLTLEDSGGLTAAVFASAFKIDLNDLITPEFKSLKTAINNYNLTEVELLLDKLTYINETDSNENTILMYAVATNNNLEIVKAILKKNPDLSIKNLDKKTALDIAKVSKKRNMIELLDSYKSANVKPRLLKPISSFNPQVKPVKSVTMEPIKEEENESSKELLEVLDAIREDNLNRVKALLDSLKDINEVTPGGWTILNFIVFGNHNLEILKEILKKNPDLSIKTPRGETTLELAKRRERTEMIELLEIYSSKPVNVRPVNVNVRPINANVRPVNPVNANVKPKGRNSKCDIVDSLTVAKINEVFKEINQSIPAAKVLKAERLQILKDLLGC
jgi:ankyrin repeat protein